MSHIEMLHIDLTNKANRKLYRKARKVKANAVSTLMSKTQEALAKHLNDYCAYHQPRHSADFTFDSKGTTGTMMLSREAREVFGFSWTKYDSVSKEDYVAMAQWLYSRPSIRKA